MFSLTRKKIVPEAPPVPKPSSGKGPRHTSAPQEEGAVKETPAPRTNEVDAVRHPEGGGLDAPSENLGNPEREVSKKKKKNLSINLNFKFGSAPHIPVQERVNFSRHLSVAIQSGLPLIEGLRLIQTQLPSKRLVKIVTSIIEGVNSGQTLAQALSKYQKTFGEFFISMVRVGEASGSLSQNLLHLSKELRKQQEIRSKAKSAMIYPAVVLVATVGMSIGLTVFIFPKILPIFTSLRVELPLTTRMVIAFMEFIQTRGYLAGGILVATLIALRTVISFKKIHYYFDRFLLWMPVASKIIINITLANFCRSLAIMLKSGMTLTDSLAVTRVTFHNLYYQRQVEQIIDGVRKGEEIAEYMATKPHLFPPMLTGMIKVGEHTGNLEENLHYLSEYFTEEVEISVRNLTSLLEPILVLVMGLVVGFIALSIIMPIYSITQGLNVK